MRELALAACGVGIGFLGTLLGLGGGFILVPFLLYFHGFSKPLAVGTSHLVIVLNAFSGALAYDRQRKIDYTLAVSMGGAAMIPAAVAALFFVPRIESPWFLVAFATLMIGGAVYILARGRLADVPQEPPGPRALPLAIAISVAGGFIAVMLGIGGGIFYVPLLILLLRKPVHTATATSQFILLLSSLVAATALILKGQVQLDYAIWLGIGVIVGAQVGARVAPLVRGPALRAVFATAVTVMAGKLLFDGVRALTRS